MKTILLTVWFIIWGYGSIFFPRWATVLIPLFLPAYLIWFTAGGIPFNVVEFMVYLTALFFILRRIFQHKFGEDLRMFVKSEWFAPIVVLLVASVISVAVVPAEGLDRALGILKGWIVMPMLFFFLLHMVRKQAKARYVWAMRSLVEIGAILSLVAIGQLFLGKFITPDGRASAFFESANFLALFLAPVFVYATVRFVEIVRQQGKIFWKWLYFFVWAIVAIGLLATKSFAGGIAAFVGIGFYFALKNVKLDWKKIVAAVVVVVIAISGLFYLLDFGQRESTKVRLEVYEVSLAMIKENPITGLGFGQFESVYKEMAPEVLEHAPKEWVMLHPHNIFLAFWLNMGILGLVGFLWILFLAFRKAFKEKDRTMFVFAAVLVAIIVHGLFDVPFFKNDLALLFWVVIAG